jgi:micrococcal nuclease
MRSGRSEISTLLALLQRAGLFKGRRKGIYLLLILILVFVSLYFKSRTQLSGNGSEYTVESVIDGDTIILNDITDTRVRYLGIDTPEILTEESPGDPLSEEARNLNKSLVYGKKIKLEFDKEKYDAYGRTLANVFVDNIFVNEEIVRSGLARALIIKPNEKYASIIYEAEEQARRERKGIWSDLSKLSPPSENSNFLIKPPQASRYVDQRVVVRGKITDFRKSKKVIILSMENDLDIVIFPDSWENFEFFGITPEKYYVGRPVEVIGRVKMYKGRPEIIISHPISIRSLR